jgi:predicted DNA-binding transcriptional regulator AlpA
MSATEKLKAVVAAKKAAREARDAALAKNQKRYLRFRDVRQRYADAPTSTLYDAIKRGLFPKPHELFPGSRIKVWDGAVLDAHDAAMLARRDAKNGGGA